MVDNPFWTWERTVDGIAQQFRASVVGDQLWWWHSTKPGSNGFSWPQPDFDFRQYGVPLDVFKQSVPQDVVEALCELLRVGHADWRKPRVQPQFDETADDDAAATWTWEAADAAGGVERRRVALRADGLTWRVGPMIIRQTLPEFARCGPTERFGFRRTLPAAMLDELCIRVQVTERPWLRAWTDDENDWLHVVRSRDLRELERREIDDPAGLNNVNPNGRTPLHEALDGMLPEDRRFVERMLELGADVRMPWPDGTSVLHTAAERGWPTLVEACLQAGVEVDGLNARGTTPLGATAAMAESDDRAFAVRLLLDAGANPNVSMSSTQAESIVEHARRTTKLRFLACLTPTPASPPAEPLPAPPPRQSDLCAYARADVSDRYTTPSGAPGGESHWAFWLEFPAEWLAIWRCDEYLQQAVAKVYEQLNTRLAAQTGDDAGGSYALLECRTSVLPQAEARR